MQMLGSTPALHGKPSQVSRQAPLVGTIPSDRRGFGIEGGYTRHMGPLSAVACSVWLLIVGLNDIAWISAQPKVIGVLAIIAVVVILIDTFWRWSRTRVAR